MAYVVPKQQRAHGTPFSRDLGTHSDIWLHSHSVLRRVEAITIADASQSHCGTRAVACGRCLRPCSGVPCFLAHRSANLLLCAMCLLIFRGSEGTVVLAMFFWGTWRGGRHVFKGQRLNSSLPLVDNARIIAQPETPLNRLFTPSAAPPYTPSAIHPVTLTTTLSLTGALTHSTPVTSSLTNPATFSRTATYLPTATMTPTLSFVNLQLPSTVFSNHRQLWGGGY